MKIKLATIYASPRITAQPGQVIEVSAEEGAQLVAGRFGFEVAEKVRPVAVEIPDAIETTDTAAPENAAVRISSRGRRNRPAVETPAE